MEHYEYVSVTFNVLSLLTLISLTFAYIVCWCNDWDLTGVTYGFGKKLRF
jgi:hypothetical protein